MTNIYLFIGIESYAWKVTDFQPVIDFAKAHDIDGLLVKVFDGMQGEWYNGQFPQIYDLITKAGLKCVPYGFHYGFNKGSDLVGEANLGVKYMHTYGTYCANMESSWDGQGDWGGQIAQIIADAKKLKAGQWWVSSWANPVEHNWVTILNHLAPVIDAWMPECYNNALYETMLAETVNTTRALTLDTHKIQPTFEISLTEFGSNDPAHLAMRFSNNPTTLSLWEWLWAKQSPQTTDAIVQAIRLTTGSLGKPPGGTPVTLVTNNGAVLDLPKSFQLDNAQQESQDMCGPWTAAELRFAGLPGKGPAASGDGHENPVDDWAEGLYTKYIGPNTISNQAGSSIENMHTFFHDSGLHYWDLGMISPGSTQSSDLAHIKAALAAGYPVVVTVNEQSVHSKKLGGSPYPWQPGLGPVNHIFTIVGVDSAGDFICCDELNNQEGWPMVYLAANIEIHWASVVQVVGPDPSKPWLAQIPSGDPTDASWKGFNAQLFAQSALSGPPPPAVDTVLQAATNEWNAVAGQLIAGGVPFDTGIAKAWLADYRAGHYHGPVLGLEQGTKTPDGSKSIRIQYFVGGSYTWDGSPHWHPFS